MFTSFPISWLLTQTNCHFLAVGKYFQQTVGRALRSSSRNNPGVYSALAVAVISQRSRAGSRRWERCWDHFGECHSQSLGTWSSLGVCTCLDQKILRWSCFCRGVNHKVLETSGDPGRYCRTPGTEGAARESVNCIRDRPDNGAPGSRATTWKQISPCQGKSWAAAADMSQDMPQEDNGALLSDGNSQCSSWSCSTGRFAAAPRGAHAQNCAFNKKKVEKSSNQLIKNCQSQSYVIYIQVPDSQQA